MTGPSLDKPHPGSFRHPIRAPGDTHRESVDTDRQGPDAARGAVVVVRETVVAIRMSSDVDRSPGASLSREMVLANEASARRML